MGIHGACKAGRPCLILDKTPSRYRRILSDLAGFDNVRGYGNRPEDLIREVRNWVRQQSHGALPSARQVAELWKSYRAALPRVRREMRLLGEGPTHEFTEYRQVISDWVSKELQRRRDADA